MGQNSELFCVSSHRKTAAHFCWKCSVSTHCPTQNRCALLLEMLCFYALSHAKPLRTFAGNALTPWSVPAFLFQVIRMLAQGFVLIIKKNPHRGAVQVFQLPTAHAPKKRKQPYDAHSKCKHNKPDKRLVHGGHPDRLGHVWQMGRIASFL